MPGNKLVFDTNAFIAWSFEDADLAQQAVGYSEPALTLISVGELVFGALKSGKPAANRQDINRRLAGFHLLIPDRTTADVYGEVCFALRRKGRPIPDNDIWIAALALQHGLPVLTRWAFPRGRRVECNWVVKLWAGHFQPTFIGLRTRGESVPGADRRNSRGPRTRARKGRTGVAHWIATRRSRSSSGRAYWARSPRRSR